MSWVKQSPLMRSITVRQSLIPGHPGGPQSPFSHGTHCVFFPQQTPVAVAGANGSQVLFDIPSLRHIALHNCRDGVTMHLGSCVPGNSVPLKSSNKEVQAPCGPLWALRVKCQSQARMPGLFKTLRQGRRAMIPVTWPLESHVPAWATGVLTPGRSGECGFSEEREERSWEKAAGQIAGIPEDDLV